MKKILSIILLMLMQGTLMAQQYTIGGVIKNVKGESLQSATVFLAGSQRATITNSKGEFELPGVAPGNYELMVSMIGYAPIKKDIAVKSKGVFLDTAMQVKPVILNEVKIGSGTLESKYFKTFVKAFLGTSANARSCTILNPEKIEFATTKDLLKAYAEDLIIIENKNLGYRIKYLLRKFEHDEFMHRTIYAGEAIFEELPGTDEQKAKRVVERQLAYDGSLMSYLRTLHTGTTREAGFLTYKFIDSLPGLITAAPQPTEPLINRLGPKFIAFKDTIPLLIVYDKKKAAKPDVPAKRFVAEVPDVPTRTTLQITSEIDDRGAYSRAKHYWLYGYWGEKRVGDLLPLEYQPQVP